MKKSHYKEAIRTVTRADRYGVGKYHPLSPDKEVLETVLVPLNHMFKQTNKRFNKNELFGSSK